MPRLRRLCGAEGGVRMSRPGILRAVVTAVTIALATGASAQSAPTELAGDNAFSLPFGPVPAEIFGVPCEPRPGDANFAPSLRCSPANVMERPSISVTVADWRSQPTRAEMIANMREAFHERPIFNVIREENFAPPSDPEAVGFRGLYQTELGNRYVWAVLSRGKMIRVIAAVFAPTDFAAMTADIERKIFGVPTLSTVDDRD